MKKFKLEEKYGVSTEEYISLIGNPKEVPIVDKLQIDIKLLTKRCDIVRRVYFNHIDRTSVKYMTDLNSMEKIEDLMEEIKSTIDKKKESLERWEKIISLL